MGGLGATPIINKPEVGILGVHNAKDVLSSSMAELKFVES